MLADPVHRAHPYPCFTVEPAFSPEVCDRLEGLFDQDLPWREHGGSFYEVRNCDLTERLDPPFLTALAGRMGALTGLPLTQQVAVTAQTMAPGQRIGVHSDRPLVGYESARLVVQLNRHWQPGDGGVLQVHDDEAGSRVLASQPPRFNSAFGFALHPGSFHSVTVTAKPRRTLVFNFWHLGNSPALGEAVQALFARMQFGELPRSLDQDRTQAEATLAEEQTYLALVVATALQRWGLPESVILAGYQAALGAPMPAEHAAATAVTLARWAARLHVAGFDLAEWQGLSPVLAAIGPGVRSTVAAFGRIASPGSPAQGQPGASRVGGRG